MHSHPFSETRLYLVILKIMQIKRSEVESASCAVQWNSEYEVQISVDASEGHIRLNMREIANILGEVKSMI